MTNEEKLQTIKSICSAELTDKEKLTVINSILNLSVTEKPEVDRTNLCACEQHPKALSDRELTENALAYLREQKQDIIKSDNGGNLIHKCGGWEPFLIRTAQLMNDEAFNQLIEYYYDKHYNKKYRFNEPERPHIDFSKLTDKLSVENLKNECKKYHEHEFQKEMDNMVDYFNSLSSEDRDKLIDKLNQSQINRVKERKEQETLEEINKENC